MKRLMTIIIVAGLLQLVVAGQTFSAGETELLPELQFSMPDNGEAQAYLGLAGKIGKTFTIRDIDADILVIELFSMYCPYCQKEAPNVNELYQKMLERSVSKPKLKIIGIGASNSRFEVDHFRDTYHVQFPLFPDQDMAMYKALKGEGTPGFIGVRLKKDAPPEIILRNSGGFYVADEFLKELLAKTGL